MAVDLDTLPYRPCVGVMLLNAAGRVFVGQRRDNEGPAWQMPQGGIDPGEDHRSAAVRELEEETGIVPSLTEFVAETDDWLNYDLPPHLMGRLWGGKYRGQTQRWVLLRFTGMDADVNIETVEPEFSEWCWLPADQLLDSIVPFKREVYAQVIDAFRDHL